MKRKGHKIEWEKSYLELKSNHWQQLQTAGALSPYKILQTRKYMLREPVLLHV